MTKHVKVTENVHGRLLYLKQQSQAKSINDVISALVAIAEEQYLTDKITTKNKIICLKYDNEKLVELTIEPKRVHD